MDSNNVYVPSDSILYGDYEKIFDGVWEALRNAPDNYLIEEGGRRIYKMQTDGTIRVVTAISGENFTDYTIDEVNACIARKLANPTLGD